MKQIFLTVFWKKKLEMTFLLETSLLKLTEVKGKVISSAHGLIFVSYIRAEYSNQQDIERRLFSIAHPKQLTPITSDRDKNPKDFEDQCHNILKRFISKAKHSHEQNSVGRKKTKTTKMMKTMNDW